ncbi:RNA helicase, putative [Giardia lamblia P15]|uniref:RNA helicase, putative n=1 Tax=Giardia intestinalis (strain P15) TaxID=658858 RepID=E1F6A5_GIAIA|nr:RNA helicase, putative [Giardia lamblia P15]
MIDKHSQPALQEPYRKRPEGREGSSPLLPVELYFTSILNSVISNDITFIHAETGSGKSTRIPQLLSTHLADIVKVRNNLDNPSQSLVVVVQPRRIAAISLARYVATMMGEDPGHTVGYEVRLSQCRSLRTRILYVTEGILLNWVRPGGTFLSSVGVLILDEIHERSVSLDLICGLFATRPTLLRHTKLVLMSATACYDTFRRFFGGHSMLHVHIPGRLHQIRLNYIDALNNALLAPDQFSVLARLVRYLHETEPLDAGVLVFLPGQAEINKAFKLIIKELEDPRLSMDQGSAGKGRESIALFKLYSLLPLAEQNNCLYFKTNLGNPVDCKRKIVLATTIAETSLTIPGIRIVIDLGLSRVSRYYPTLHMTALETCLCSREQADQRKGRAGREGPGQCYRLYTRKTYLQMPITTEPEICRARSESLLLWLTANRFKLRTFPFISPPSLCNLAAAYDELHALSIVDADGNLTEAGALTFEFSVMFQHGRMLAEVILDTKHNNTLMLSVYKELIIIIACIETFFNTDTSIQWSVNEKTIVQRLRSDHLAFLVLYNSYLKAKYKTDWCHTHGVPHHLMQYCNDLVEQLSRCLLAQCPELNNYVPPQDANLVSLELKRYLRLGYGIHRARLNQYGSYSIVHSSCAADKQLNQLTLSPKSLLAHSFPNEIIFTTAVKAVSITLYFATELDDT